MGNPHRQKDWNDMIDLRSHKATEEYLAKRDAIPHFGEAKMTTINLGLTNEVLYQGCEIEEVAGRLNLKTPIAEAINLVGRNVAKLVDDLKDRTEITLTGPMAVWSYLVVFHAVVHSFTRVYYSDGKNSRVLIAAHG
jgi:hypothetical protein